MWVIYTVHISFLLINDSLLQAAQGDMEILAASLDRIFWLLSIIAIIVITFRAEPLVSGTLKVLMSWQGHVTSPKNQSQANWTLLKIKWSGDINYEFGHDVWLISMITIVVITVHIRRLANERDIRFWCHDEMNSWQRLKESVKGKICWNT